MKVDLDVFHEDLAFVRVARYSGAVLYHEVIEWGYAQIKKYDNLPTFIFELVECDENQDMFSQISVFHSKHLRANLTNREHRALYGIAYKRGFYSKENPCELCTEKTALKNLENNPHILERFKEIFPFIKLD